MWAVEDDHVVEEGKQQGMVGDTDSSKSGSGYLANPDSTPLFRDREHQTAQSPYGMVSFLCGTGRSSTSIRKYQGREIEPSRDGRGKVDLCESHLDEMCKEVLVQGRRAEWLQISIIHYVFQKPQEGIVNVSPRKMTGDWEGRHFTWFMENTMLTCM